MVPILFADSSAIIAPARWRTSCSRSGRRRESVRRRAVRLRHRTPGSTSFSKPRPGCSRRFCVLAISRSSLERKSAVAVADVPPRRSGSVLQIRMAVAQLAE
jgi:hypothetical protein